MMDARKTGLGTKTAVRLEVLLLTKYYLLYIHVTLNGINNTSMVCHFYISEEQQTEGENWAILAGNQ